MTATNYNYVPWLSILGIIGAAIGYVTEGGSGPKAMQYALFGLLIGTVLGMIVRTVIRYRDRSQKEMLQPRPDDKNDDNKPLTD